MTVKANYGSIRNASKHHHHGHNITNNTIIEEQEVENEEEEEKFMKSIDYYQKRESSRQHLTAAFTKSDTHLTVATYTNFNESFRQDYKPNANTSLILSDAELIESASRDDYSQTSNDVLLSHTLCNCSYIVEPVAFIQNLASSIMGICLGQFIYTRILNRLVKEAMDNMSNSTTPFTPRFSNFLFSNASNQTRTCANMPEPGQNGSKLFLLEHAPSRMLLETMNSYYANPAYNIFTPPQTNNGLYGSDFYSNNYRLSQDEMEKIRNSAQEQTANLYFISSFFIGIPVIIMTNVLGVNCAALGRKTLMLVFLVAMTLKFTLILFQCLNPEWPDWLFYAGAFLEGISGSSGVFYLSLYCYIADFTAPSARSYRITLLNNLNSLASLCVTFACGYAIKYYGFVYLFLSSAILMFIALVYTLFLIPEPLIELRDKSLMHRLKLCSLRKAFMCFHVWFSREHERIKKESRNKTEAESKLNLNQVDENRSLIGAESRKNVNDNARLSKQTTVLLLIVIANFIYNFGALGLGSIFGLFIMNAPFCFDSIEISKYSVFATVISLVASLAVSKFLKINDVLVCILSVFSFFSSVFCYIFGQTSFYIYLGAAISSIAGLQYGYVRSIVSKNVEKHEVSDALALILLVDTIISVCANIIFPVLYKSVVAFGVWILFAISNGFIFVALVFHIINYFIYKPPVEFEEKSKRKFERKPTKSPKLKKRNVFLTGDKEEEEEEEEKREKEEDINRDNEAIIRTCEQLIPNPNGEPINSPQHQALVLSSVDF